MKFVHINLIKLLITIPLLTFSLSACAGSDTGKKPPDAVVITNIAAWHHPAKKIFTKNKVKLSKIILTKHNKYFIFYVSFPYDPQSSQTSNYFNQLYAELLAANGWVSYALHDEQDKIQIDVNWDKTKKVMTTNFVPLN